MQRSSRKWSPPIIFWPYPTSFEIFWHNEASGVPKKGGCTKMRLQNCTKIDVTKFTCAQMGWGQMHPSGGGYFKQCKLKLGKGKENKKSHPCTWFILWKMHSVSEWKENIRRRYIHVYWYTHTLNQLNCQCFGFLAKLFRRSHLLVTGPTPEGTSACAGNAPGTAGTRCPALLKKLFSQDRLFVAKGFGKTRTQCIQLHTTCNIIIMPAFQENRKLNET